MVDSESAPVTAPAELAKNPAPDGLTAKDAAAALTRDGPNALPDTSESPWKRVFKKFWAPVPWLLEAAIVLQLILHKEGEAAVIAGLLVFNAVLAYTQESKAQATLTALKSRLAFKASVRRDGKWSTLPAEQLVRGDLVKLSLGSVVPADVHLVEGNVSLDQSMLTGESLPLEGSAGTDTFAGALVRRGEATATVTATGERTKFGRSAELIRKAHPKSSQEQAVLRVVRNLAFFNGSVILAICGYSVARHTPWAETIPLLLTSILAAIPVALPATFTLASAIGARRLAKLGVLPTRLSAVDEAATVDVLCCDKTGTLTRNELAVASVKPMPNVEEAYLLGMAALASSDGGQDAVDAAIRSASAAKPTSLPKLKDFVPFDPAQKTSAATASDAQGAEVRIVKGAVASIRSLVSKNKENSISADDLAKQGFRVLAVAAGPPNAMRLLGFIGLSDPPRDDSAALVSELKTLGVTSVMVTGDAPATAQVVAKAVGLDATISPAGPLAADLAPKTFAIYAGILPEGKFDLVKAFQKSGSSVAMCGDGANDAPALRQAQCGVAVCTATDVAKSAAGIVLTTEGLVGVVAAVKEGRATFQRVLTYTLNSVIKKIAQVLVLAVGLVLLGHAVLTPMLMVIVMITGDFLAMSLTTDTVTSSTTPNSWQVGRITAAGCIFGGCLLAFCTGVLAVGHFRWHLPIGSLRTMTAVALVFGSQAVLYAIRARQSFWGARPSNWLLASSVADVTIISTLALCGFAMQRLPLLIVALELLAAVMLCAVLFAAKRSVFRLVHLA